MSRSGKRHTLLLSLLQQTRSSCRDELIEMLLRRVRKTQAAAKEKLETLQEQNRDMEEDLIAIFGKVLETAKNGKTDAKAGRQIRTLLAEQGGIDALADRCQTVAAWHGNNDLPLLWPIHANTRTLLFHLLDLMDIHPATQDRSLLDALAVVVRHRHARGDDLKEQVDLGFASQRWQSFIVKQRTDPIVLSRRALEVCVVVHLAEALQVGDTERVNDFDTPGFGI
jgi:urease gamma subunit